MEFSRVAVVCGVLVLAGCLALAVPQGPGFDQLTGDGSPATDEQTDPATVERGNWTTPVADRDRVAAAVPVSQTLPFERLQRLLAVDGDRPAVRVGDMNDSHRFEPSDFQQTMGITERPDPGLDVTGLYRDGQIGIDPGEAPPAVVEQVLVHEYVHALQRQFETTGWLDSPAPPDASTDTLTARAAVIEGGAIWVTSQYADAYLPNATRTAGLRADTWREESAAAASVVGPYYFGGRYVASHVDEPANLPDIYENPPNTTEQVLHNRTPAQAPPASLSLSVDSGPHEVVHEDSVGELQTLVVLRSELERTDAWTAAAGWGTDRLRKLELDGTDADYGYVWAHRWDTSTDADEFAAAMEHFEATRSNATGDVRNLERVSDETTVVFAGPESFVTTATAGGTTENVTVAVGPAG